MKKLLSSLASIVALAIAFVGIANAQLLISDLFSWKEALNAGSYAKLLNEYDNSWWYSSYDVIEWEITGGVLSIKSPVVVDWSVDLATEYRLIISPYRIDTLKSVDSTIDLANVIMKSAKLEADSDDVYFELSPEDDNIDPEIWYYGVVAPLDMYNVIWAPSKEFCFQFTGNLYQRDEACNEFEVAVTPAPVEVTTEDSVVDGDVVATWDGNIAKSDNTEEHWAAGCAWMDLANVSHTVNGDQVTLTWTAVDWDSVEVAIFDPEEEVYVSLWTVNMKDEKYVYKMQWNGEQNFMLTNGCREVFYKADAAVKPQPTIVPAATGPAENVLYIAIATIVLYGVYVVFFRKADNK